MGFRFQFLEKGRRLTAAEREERAALRRITQIQNQFTKRFVARYHQAVREIGKKITAANVLEAARSGDPSVIANQIEAVDFLPLTKGSARLYIEKVDGDPFTQFDLLLELILAQVSTEIRSMKRALLLTPQGGTGIEFAFNIDNPFTKPALQRATFDLVDGLAGNTKEAVRNALEDMFLEGTGPRQAAKELRDILGLNSQQALAYRNTRARLVDQGLSGAKLDGTMRATARTMRAQRAELIARTETLRVQNQARSDAWRQAVDEGFLSASMKRQWVAPGDDRTDDLCFELESLEPVGLEEPFSSSGGDFMDPPAHPNCRCTVVLVAP